MATIKKIELKMRFARVVLDLVKAADRDGYDRGYKDGYAEGQTSMKQEKPIRDEESRMNLCPRCRRPVSDLDAGYITEAQKRSGGCIWDHCGWCGQALDWSEEAADDE